MRLHPILLPLLGLSVPQSSPPPPAAGAPQPPALVAEPAPAVSAARGLGAQSFRLGSVLLKEARRVLIVLPASYGRSSPARRYPVTVVVDGEFLAAPVVAVSEELSRNGQVPEAVIVGIENVGGADLSTSNAKRVHDLTPPGLSVSGSGRDEGGDLFLDFIELELLPAVDRQFRTAAPRTFVGHSSGAILATYAAATRSTYRCVVALDAPVHLDDAWLAKQLIARAQLPGEPVRYASLEAQFGWSDGAWQDLVAAAPASWGLHRAHLSPEESHESMPMLGAYLGLRQVFRDYSLHAAPDLPAAGVLARYAAVGTSLGAPVIPPEKLLRRAVDDLLAQGLGAAAREAYELLATGYGTPADGAAVLARVVEVERRAAPTETVAGLLATPFPTPEEARAFLGEWVGDISMRADTPRTGSTLLRIAVVDGRVVGETVHRTEPGEEQALRWEYLKITPQGMTWGRMNSRRPRGVVLFEGKLEGDTLSGQSRFGGIDFRGDDGLPPPPLFFSFERTRQ